LEKEITSKGIHFQHCWGDITGVRRTPCWILLILFTQTNWASLQYV
jgi:hypothetical protein